MSAVPIDQETIPASGGDGIGSSRRATLDRRLRVSATPRAMAKARATVAKVLAEWGVTDLAFDASLIVDELLTNVVKHCPTTQTATVALTYDGVRIQIAVSDTNHVVPRIPDPDEMGIHGRGLLIVRSLAANLTISHTPAGKTVTATLVVPDEPIFQQLWAEVASVRGHPNDSRWAAGRTTAVYLNAVGAGLSQAEYSVCKWRGEAQQPARASFDARDHQQACPSTMVQQQDSGDESA